MPFFTKEKLDLNDVNKNEHKKISFGFYSPLSLLLYFVVSSAIAYKHGFFNQGVVPI